MTQPTLSQNLRQLEETVGTQLVLRSTRKVEVTPAGRVFYEYACLSMETAKRGKSLALRAAHGEHRISLGVTSAGLYGKMPEVMRSLSSRQPEIEWAIQEYRNDDIVAALRNGEIDLAIFHGCCTDLTIEGIGLEREKCFLVLPVGHRLSRSKGAISLDELDGERFLIPPQSISFGHFEMFIAACSETCRRVHVVPYSGGVHTLAGLVAANMGITRPEKEVHLWQTS